MRKIINSTYLSLDGVVENPHLWPRLAAPSDERADQIQTDLLLKCDIVLMGRRTYDSFAAAWPTRSGDPASDRINSMSKYVVSSTLTDPQWANTTVINGEVARRVEELKAQPGQDIVQYGIGPVTRLMMENDLLDELRIWLYPQTIGSGTPEDLLFGHAVGAQFTVAGTTILTNGIIVITYEIVRS